MFVAIRAVTQERNFPITADVDTAMSSGLRLDHRPVAPGSEITEGQRGRLLRHNREAPKEI